MRPLRGCAPGLSLCFGFASHFGCFQQAISLFSVPSTSSLSIALSSDRSATGFFNCPFSFSSTLSRLIVSSLAPPYSCRRQPARHAGKWPGGRHSSRAASSSGVARASSSSGRARRSSQRGSGGDPSNPLRWPRIRPLSRSPLLRTPSLSGRRGSGRGTRVPLRAGKVHQFAIEFHVFTQAAKFCGRSAGSCHRWPDLLCEQCRVSTR